MWQHRMTQHSIVTTRLIIIFQHRGEARKPRSNCSMSLKGAKTRGGAVGRRILLYFELTPSAIRRDGDDAIIIFIVGWGLDYSGVVTQPD